MSLWRRIRTLWYLSGMEVGLTDYKTGKPVDKGPLLDVAKRLNKRKATIVEPNALDNINL